jgi:hypothetical protein
MLLTLPIFSRTKIDRNDGAMAARSKVKSPSSTATASRSSRVVQRLLQQPARLMFRYPAPPRGDKPLYCPPSGFNASRRRVGPPSSFRHDVKRLHELKAHRLKMLKAVLNHTHSQRPKLSPLCHDDQGICAFGARIRIVTILDSCQLLLGLLHANGVVSLHVGTEVQ